MYVALDAESEVYNQESILEGFKSTEEQDKYVKQLIGLYEMKKEWSKNNIDIASLSMKELEIMNDYLIENNRVASSAIAVLALNNELTYEEPIYYPRMSKSLEISELNEITQEEEYMIVYPNPAVDFSSVRYAYLEPYTKLSLSIVDINGRVVYTLMLSHAEDEIVLPITKFSKGNYIVNIEADGKVVYSEKLIKK